jgi:hypothetical protein
VNRYIVQFGYNQVYQESVDADTEVAAYSLVMGRFVLGLLDPAWDEFIDESVEVAG